MGSLSTAYVARTWSKKINDFLQPRAHASITNSASRYDSFLCAHSPKCNQSLHTRTRVLSNKQYYFSSINRAYKRTSKPQIWSFWETTRGVLSACHCMGHNVCSPTQKAPFPALGTHVDIMAHSLGQDWEYYMLGLTNLVSLLCSLIEIPFFGVDVNNWSEKFQYILF